MPGEFVPTETELSLLEMMRDFAPLFNSYADEGQIESMVIFDRVRQAWTFEVDGFYKHGKVTILRAAPKERGWSKKYQVIGRYGDLEQIDNFADLLSLNYGEWLSWRDRGYEVNDSWLPHLIEAGLVKKVVKTETTYEPS